MCVVLFINQVYFCRVAKSQFTEALLSQSTYDNKVRPGVDSGTLCFIPFTAYIKKGPKVCTFLKEPFKFKFSFQFDQSKATHTKEGDSHDQNDNLCG